MPIHHRLRACGSGTGPERPCSLAAVEMAFNPLLRGGHQGLQRAGARIENAYSTPPRLGVANILEMHANLSHGAPDPSRRRARRGASARPSSSLAVKSAQHRFRRRCARVRAGGPLTPSRVRALTRTSSGTRPTFDAAPVLFSRAPSSPIPPLALRVLPTVGWAECAPPRTRAGRPICEGAVRPLSLAPDCAPPADST